MLAKVKRLETDWRGCRTCIAGIMPMEVFFAGGPTGRAWAIGWTAGTPNTEQAPGPTLVNISAVA